MRFHKPLSDILGSRIKVDVLRLLSRTRSDHTGRGDGEHYGVLP